MSKFWTMGWLALGVICASCSIRQDTLPPGSPIPDEGRVVFDEAVVEEVSVIFLESFPLQVRVTASGYLPNPCSWVEEVTVERNGQDFKVRILKGHHVGEICIQVEEAFEQSFALDVYGLSAGEYTIDVNGVQTEFTFTQDNILYDGG